MPELLRDKIAVVSGAAHPQGIGRAIADAFEGEGAQVTITDLSGVDLDACDGIACDVTDRNQVAKLIATVMERHGRIDIVVNNAGVGVGNVDFLQLTDQDWDLSLAVNLRGVVNVCQAAIPNMLESGGAIINVASLAGLGAMDGIPACYTASKFATIGVTRQLAAQFARHNIRCNALCPGSVLTQMHTQSMALLAEHHGITTEDAARLEASNIPLGRSAEAAEVAHAAVFLASDLASYITGVSLPVAGGMAPGL